MTQLLAALLVGSMLSAGLALDRDRRVRLRGEAGALLRVVAASFSVVPLVAWAVGHAFALTPQSRQALLLVALCAGGASGPALAGLARADVAGTGVMSLALALTSAVVATVAFGASVEQTATMLAAQLAPLAIGLWLAARLPAVAARLVRPVSLATTALLMVIIVGFTVLRGHELLQQQVSFLAAAVLVVIASAAAGHLAAGTSGALSAGVRNLALALMLAAPSEQGSVLVFGLLMFVGLGGWALARGLRRSRGTA